jgi:hypothetical protein
LGLHFEKIATNDLNLCYGLSTTNDQPHKRRYKPPIIKRMAPTETDEVLQQCAELVRDELDVLQVGLFFRLEAATRS